MTKINLGCGADKKKGYVNIDGCDIFNPDMLINLDEQRLSQFFNKGSVSEVFASDIIEHFLRFHAIDLLKDIYTILEKGGRIELKLPNTNRILNSDCDNKTKILHLYGSQGVSMGNELDEGRKSNPSFFCHKYGWTPESLTEVLREIGFVDIEPRNSLGFNFIITASK